MINKERQIKNSVAYLLPVIISNVLSLITLPIFTRILSKEDYGALALAQVYGIFATGLANFGLITVYERDFFQHRDERQAANLLYSTVLFVLTTSGLLGLLTLFLKGPIARLVTGDPGLGSLFLWAFCASSIMSLKMYYLIYFKNSESAKNYVGFVLCESAVTFIASTILVAGFRVGVAGILWGQMIAGSAVLLLLNFRFLRHLPFSVHAAPLKESLKASYPLTAKSLFSIAGNHFDKYMISLMNSTGGVGIFSIGQRLANVAFIYMTAIQNVFSPEVFKRMFHIQGGGQASIGLYLVPFAYLSILLALGIALFGEEAVIVILPKSYHGAIDIISVLSMYYGFLFFSKVTSTQLTFSKKNHITTFINLFNILLNATFNIPLIMKWGAIGAAWGTFCAGSITVCVGLVVSQKYFKLDWERGKMAVLFVVFFASTITVLLLRTFLDAYLVRLAFKLVAMTGYILLGVRLNVITRDNYLLLKNILINLRNRVGGLVLSQA